MSYGERKKQMNKILKICAKSIYYSVIVVLIILLLNNLLMKSDKLFKLVRFRSYTISSRCMEPKILPGDLVIVESVNTQSLKNGEIITFNSNNSIVTHRIIEIENRVFKTKGDNKNVKDDDLVYKNEVIGRVVKIIPKIGTIVALLSKLKVNSILIIIILMWIIWNMVIKEDNKIENKILNKVE